MSDPIEKPAHYNTTSLQPIEVIEEFRLGFHLGNAIKYLARAGLKGDYAEDLGKARWYLKRRISFGVAEGNYAPQVDMAWRVARALETWKPRRYAGVAIASILAASCVVDLATFLKILENAIEAIDADLKDHGAGN